MTVKIGMVGTGGFSRLHADILGRMDGVSLVAVCGTSQEKSDAFAEKYPGAKGYYPFSKMIEEEKLDAVYLCVPPMAHGEMELTLIERGIPFFVEKPLSVDETIPNEILEALKGKPVTTSVGYHFRYRESIQFLKEHLKTHKIGMVTGRWMGSMPGVSWWRNQEQSGGQFNEQTTHIIDLLRYLIGEVKEVHAFAEQRVMHKKEDNVTVADVGSLNMKFASGILATITNTCVMPEGMEDVGFTFYTDKGMIEWTPNGMVTKTREDESPSTDRLDPYELENEAFIYAVKTGDRKGILSSYEDAIETQRISGAITDSIEKQTVIKR